MIARFETEVDSISMIDAEIRVPPKLYLKVGLVGPRVYLAIAPQWLWTLLHQVVH
jgi:hypothetical protein